MLALLSARQWNKRRGKVINIDSAQIVYKYKYACVKKNGGREWWDLYKGTAIRKNMVYLLQWEIITI